MPTPWDANEEDKSKSKFEFKYRQGMGTETEEDKFEWGKIQTIAGLFRVLSGLKLKLKLNFLSFPSLLNLNLAFYSTLSSSILNRCSGSG